MNEKCNTKGTVLVPLKFSGETPTNFNKDSNFALRREATNLENDMKCA